MQKTRLVELVMLTVVSVTSLNATIWTLDNTPGNIANFNSITEALTSTDVVDGDTLYVAGSHISYGGMSLTKRLAIFGPGYWLSENGETQNAPLSATFVDVLIDGTNVSSDPSGSLLSGLEISGYLRLSGGFEATKHVHDIIITRCKMYRFQWTTAFQYSSVYDILISDSYIGHIVEPFASGINTGGYNINFANNYIHNLWSNTAHCSMNIINNVVLGSILTSNSVVRNNIVIGANSMYGITTSNTYQNNLISDETVAATDGNQTNVDMSGVFEGYPTSGAFSEDARWQLAAGSPAIAAGSNGEDCGMYGGSTPYVLSGIPWIPTITYLSAPSQTSPSAGLEVHIKARSRN